MKISSRRPRGQARETLSPEDRERVAESLKHRPMQFCIFLKAFLGAEEMQRMMVQAIKVAKQVPQAGGETSDLIVL